MKSSSKTFNLRIEKLVEGGRGLGLVEGRPVFVPFVLPGEVVRVGIRRHHRQYLEAELLEILEPAAERIAPPCPYFQKCGGCQWQHIDYEAQLKFKREIFIETLQRVGKIENPNVAPMIPSPKIWNWRSRATFHRDEAGRIGFFEAESHKVVDVENCLIMEEPLQEKLSALRGAGEKGKKDFELRVGDENSFTQVNPLQNENLKRLVKEWAAASPHDHIVELFCGSGNFTEVLAPLAKTILAVDSDRTAIESAQKNFPPPFPAQFLCTDALRFFAEYKSKGVLGVRPLRTPDFSEAEFTSAERIDLLVLDPPRDGAGAVVEGVLKSRPTTIIYISCNPATLARDLKYLKEFANYQLVQSQPIDMFPMSFHIESINNIQKAS